MKIFNLSVENDCMNIDSFAGKKVLIFGDVMLDKYLQGSVSRISPEAPVPVVNVVGERLVPGGAANTANNVVSLGGIAHVIGVIGADPSGSVLLQEMEKNGIDTSGIIRDANKPTIQKTRVLGNTQQMLRLDYENDDRIDGLTEADLIRNIDRTVPLVDVVVISDYGKGVITQNVVEFLHDACTRNNKKIIADPKPKNAHLYNGVFLVTPNEKEAREISNESEIEKMAETISKHLSTNALITLGERGMFLYEKNGRKISIPTEAREVFDVSGAGDTVVATLALCLAAGMSLKDSAVIANHAAGIVVGKAGTATVTIEELKRTLKSDIYSSLQETINAMQGVIEKEMGNIEELSKLIIATYKNKKKILVFGNGGSASDAQHFIGELMGRFKKERAGLPAIALNSDATVLTAISNDFGYETVFERQLEALANEGDLVMGITTSGNSANVIRALQKARSLGLKTVCLSGRTGGKVAEIADMTIRVPSDNTQKIQECHGVIIHIVCDILEKELY